MPEKNEEKEATVNYGWDNVEPLWFCEELPENVWRRAAVLWGAPAVSFFGFPAPSVRPRSWLAEERPLQTSRMPNVPVQDMGGTNLGRTRHSADRHADPLLGRSVASLQPTAVPSARNAPSTGCRPCCSGTSFPSLGAPSPRRL